MRYLVDSEPIRLFAETERRIHTDHEDLFVGTFCRGRSRDGPSSIRPPGIRGTRTRRYRAHDQPRDHHHAEKHEAGGVVELSGDGG